MKKFTKTLLFCLALLLTSGGGIVVWKYVFHNSDSTDSENLHKTTIYWWYEGLNPDKPAKPWALSTPNGDNTMLMAAQLAGFKKTRIAPYDPAKVKDDFVLVKFPTPKQLRGPPAKNKPQNEGGTIPFKPLTQTVRGEDNIYVFYYKPEGKIATQLEVKAKKKQNLTTLFKLGFEGLYQAYNLHN